MGSINGGMAFFIGTSLASEEVIAATAAIAKTTVTPLILERHSLEKSEKEEETTSVTTAE